MEISVYEYVWDVVASYCPRASAMGDNEKYFKE